ncbi:MAG TPA: LysE family translocator [Gaiellaceae bacterium]|nr:LysE family translocator [Gaiellaceae bacterium]
MAELAAFFGIAILVIVTPGQDTALTIRNSLLGGRAAGVATAAGVAAGQACWTIAASIGLAALLVASEPVFVALKLAGAAYLVYLGLHALRQAIRPVARSVERADGVPLAPGRAFRQGLLSNLGNPKMAVFFTSLLPQFGSSFWSLLVLGLVFCSLTFAWLAAYSFAVARAGDLLRRPRIRRSLDALTGTILVAFGLRLAAER